MLKDEITNFHLVVVSTRAVMTEEFCPLSVEELQKQRFKVEKRLEQFDQDWAIFEKSYVFELMAIEADARKNVCNAINLCNELTKFEETQKRKGKVFYQSEEYNKMRQLLCSEIAQINCVANVIGQGRDDLDATVLFAADEVQRKVTKS